jgi:hypothetical protein
MPAQKEARDNAIPRASFHTIEADGVKMFYREAGPKDARSFCFSTATLLRRTCFAN